MLAQQIVTKTPGAALNLAELADRYAGLLYGIGRRYRLTPEECDDAAQSTWLALCQNAERIRDPQCVPGWLATTMRRFSAAALRNRYREVPTSDSIDTFPTADARPDVADAVTARHAQAAVEPLGLPVEIGLAFELALDAGADHPDAEAGCGRRRQLSHLHPDSRWTLRGG